MAAKKILAENFTRRMRKKESWGGEANSRPNRYREVSVGQLP